MEIKESTELRKLSPKHRGELTRILEDFEKWKDIMAIIPKTLKKDNYECEIYRDNPPKYNSDHFRLIQSASRTTSKPCSEILFEEWGCSGRVRPTLGHLLFLLKRAQLFRAADYLSLILNKERPERPNEGPPALIKMTSAEVKQIQTTRVIIPKIVISQSKSDTIDLPSPPSHRVDESEANFIPAFSRLLNNSDANLPSQTNQPSETNSPTESNLMTESNVSTESANDSYLQGNLPNFPELMTLNDASPTQSDNFLPNISIFMDKPVGAESSEQMIPITVFSSTDDSNPISNVSQSPLRRSSGGNQSIPHCSSPLPNLLLNTHLPSFQYSELENATNNFDETPHVSETLSGRFLGSGAFGSVYLGLGLLDRPVAVKKLSLKDLNIVSEDAFITKQFKTEVEIICKYKHDNLLSLLGYSCDGLTYCLLYEYISGGNLKDRLEKTVGKLIWIDRLRIALGTARGVSYLHTAYATPLVHRDIKSANILLDATNKPKLCDFGIVRLSSSTTTATSQIFGTSAYMPREAHRGDVSVKLDTYSFGVVLLELLTGLPPMDDERAGRDLVTHVQDSLADENDITPLLDTGAGPWIANDKNYANELYKISLRCLQDKKSARPTMFQVTTELEDLIKL